MSDTRNRLAALVGQPTDCDAGNHCPDCIADRLIAAGVTMPAPPAVCGATTVIEGIEYVCEQGTHSALGSHWTTRGIGVVHWWGDDEASR